MVELSHSTRDQAERLLAKDAKVNPTIWTDVAQDVIRDLLARVGVLESEVKKEREYVSHRIAEVVRLEEKVDVLEAALRQIAGMDYRAGSSRRAGDLAWRAALESSRRAVRGNRSLEQDIAYEALRSTEGDKP